MGEERKEIKAMEFSEADMELLYDTCIFMAAVLRQSIRS